MSYDSQIILPVELSAFGASGGPSFETAVVRTPNGSEYRDALRGYELGKWSVRYDNKVRVTFEELHEIFRVAKGRSKSFRGVDPLDKTVSSAQGRFIATSVGTEWQCVKRYSVGSSYTDRIITKIGGTYSSAAGTLNPATGICTNATMPASWQTTLYYVQIRFDSDEMTPRIVAKELGGDYMVTWDDVTVVEVNEP